MTDTPWTIRRARAEDASFLTDMLVEAVNWSPEWKPRSRQRVLADSNTARYITGWPRDTDLGVIAEAASADLARPAARPARPGCGSCRPPSRATGSWPRTCPS